jgi:hypothetical protein
MTTFAVLTPSYAPDFELCRELNRSVLEFTGPEVEHHVIVPRRDRDLFSRLRQRNTHVWPVEEFVPRGMLAVPRANLWINIHRPYPPIRGWVMQQIVKLAAVDQLGVDVVLLADSDVTLVRRVTVDTLRSGEWVRFYRADAAVAGEGMSDHVRWHQVARQLLGLPPAGPPPLPDYICPMNVWDRQVVLALRDRIEQVTGRPWLDAIASRLHVSEFILYGVFMDEVLKTRASAATESTLCHMYWGPGPLQPEAVARFVESLSPDDVAVMISAKTNTPSSVRDEVLSRVRALVDPPTRSLARLSL